jgi:hypothetical protein
MSVESGLITGYINAISKCTISKNLISSFSHNKATLGYSDPGTAPGSFEGFIWFFSIDDVITYNNYIWDTGNACIVGGCTSTATCSRGIINLNNETLGGCIPSINSEVINANAVGCNCEAGVGCNATSCLTCPSSGSYTCYMDGYIICTTGTYPSGNLCLNCYADCATCNQTLICLTCISTNASPSNLGCICKSGYYNLTSLISSSSCILCYSDCSACSQALICTSCMAAYATPTSTIGCKCKSGYYNITSLISSSSCILCYSDCSECSQALICTSCVAAYATLTSTIGCKCNSGYYNTTSLSSLSSCIACHDNCATCNETLICLTCISANASPGSNIGCNCKSGYYNSTSLTSSSACLSCHSDCYACTQAFICSSCVATYASPTSSVGCRCNYGYYNTTSLTSSTSCIVCYSDCATCSQAWICLTCKSEYSTPASDLGCECNSGYYKNASLTSISSCIACYVDCATCSQALVCLTCKSANAVPSSLSGCNCNPGYYYDSNHTCQPCNINCITCSNSTSCTECNGTNTLVDSLNFCKCNQGYYIASTFPIVCKPCDSICSSCLSASNCSECIQTAFLVDSSCFCKTGYGTVENNCTQTFFTVSVAINQTNCLILIFEESISLYSSNLTLNLNNTNLDFTIDQKNEITYLITPTYLTDIPQNSELKIKLDSLVSKNNSLLYNTTLSINLFKTSSFSSQQELQVKIAAAKALASQGATVGLSITLGISFLNLDPTSLFNFINTAEIFYSTTLFNLNLDPVLYEFLIAMRLPSKTPKILSYIIPEEKGSSLPTKYIDYGYSTNLFLLNTRSQLSFFIVLLLLAFGIILLHKKAVCNKILKPIVPIFRYGIFLRFWVQTFLEILLCISVSIKYSQLKNTIQVIDFVLSIFALVTNN